MATLEDLAQQGDPGTLESEDQATKLKLMSPQKLYELWERQSTSSPSRRCRAGWKAIGVPLQAESVPA